LQADGGSGVTIPNPLFSPDNDGYNDVLNISYKLDESGKAANVFIYDSKGRQVRHLIRNEQLAQDGTLSWNGINDDNEKAPIGIYVVYVELFNLSGKINKYKLSCTLAGKL
jgi:flagellar hook assembly protein FlgD